MGSWGQNKSWGQSWDTPMQPAEEPAEEVKIPAGMRQTDLEVGPEGAQYLLEDEARRKVLLQRIAGTKVEIHPRSGAVYVAASTTRDVEERVLLMTRAMD